MASPRTLTRRRQRLALAAAHEAAARQRELERTAEWQRRRQLLIDGLGFREPLSLDEELHVSGLLMADMLFLRHA